MEFLDSIAYIVFCLWIIFMGGAEKLAGSIFGYLEFGWFSDHPNNIRVAAWVSMLVAVVFMFL